MQSRPYSAPRLLKAKAHNTLTNPAAKHVAGFFIFCPYYRVIDCLVYSLVQTTNVNTFSLPPRLRTKREFLPCASCRTASPHPDKSVKSISCPTSAGLPLPFPPPSSTNARLVFTLSP